MAATVQEASPADRRLAGSQGVHHGPFGLLVLSHSRLDRQPSRRPAWAAQPISVVDPGYAVDRGDDRPPNQP